MKETILAIAAHNDDHIIGAGGALARYAREGKRVVAVVCSYGEKSHPHLKAEVVKKRRVAESRKADKILGVDEVVFVGVREGKFAEDFRKFGARKIAGIIKKEKPEKVFTHGQDDAHPDHRAVYRLVGRFMDEKKIACPVYSFEVWSLVRLRSRNVPQLVVGIDETFKLKLRAFLAHESQFEVWMVAMRVLLLKLVVKDWLSGAIHGHKFAEVFYRLK